MGLLAIGFGVVSHGLHVVNSGPDWRDLTGVGMVLGGVLLLGSAVAALAAPRRPARASTACCTPRAGSSARCSCWPG